MNINDADSRITQSCSEIFNRLDALGYREFRKKNLKRTVKLMIQYAHHTNFKEAMQICMDLNKPIRKNVKIFIA